MLRLKSCPRCEKGDVTFDRDQYGWYEYCIQCGYRRDLASMSKLRRQQALGVKGGRRVRNSDRGK